jgi:hypothetical protein
VEDVSEVMEGLVVTIRRASRGTPSEPGSLPQTASARVSERAIMKQTGHRSLPTLRRYIRDGSLFRGNAAASVGL